MSTHSASAVPTVSVVIPSYNAAPTLSRAIRSVLAQDCGEPLEIIVVDDGSEDDTVRLLQREFPQVRLIAQEHTGVPAAARNRGVEAARAALIAFLDADDEWLPHKLSRQLALLRSQAEVGFVTCRSHALHPDGRRETLPDCPDIVRLELVTWLLPGFATDTGIYAYPSGWLIRRSLYLRLGGMGSSQPTAEDWRFIARVLVASEPVAVLTEPLFNYYVSPASLSRDPYRVDRANVARQVLAFIESLRPPEGTTLLTPAQHTEAMFMQARVRGRWLHRAGYLQGALELARLALAQPTGKPPPISLRFEAAALVLLRALFGPISPFYGRLFRALRRLTGGKP